MVKLTPALVYVRTKTSVENVTKLNLWGCEVDDIELCADMPKLQILSLSVNQVNDLSPLANCKSLEELYIRKNNLQDIDELQHLKDLPNLRVLWIEDNPCTEISGYRNKVTDMLPQLTTLDNIAVNHNTANDMDEFMSETIVDTLCPMSTSFTLNKSTIISQSDSDRPKHSSSDTSDDNRPEPQVQVRSGPRISHPRMSESYHFSTSTKEAPDWEDFSIEDTNTIPMGMQMSQSQCFGHRFPSGHICQSIPAVPLACNNALNYQPRKRVKLRSQSASPARRFENVITAVCVLLDELDPEGLRCVIAESQKRIKKQR